MRQIFLLLAATSCLGLSCPLAAQEAVEANEATKTSTDLQTNEYGVTYGEFTLPNGLRTVVLPDPKYPNVFVGMWYDVGAGNEPTGKTGFAHLFEHLMFEQTEHRKGDYFDALNKVGATSMNGTTNGDRTSYFQVVPPEALNLALWLESDRMGYLLGGLTQETLDAQRSVVQNEKRQSEDDSLRRAYDQRIKDTYPEGHPYRHGVIGSMKDLTAASLDDARDWYREYYGANNAVLVLAGNIDIGTAKREVGRYFAEMPVSRSRPGQQQWIPSLDENRTAVMYEATGLRYLSRTYFLPSQADKEFHVMGLVAKALGGGVDSILYRRLVTETGLATQVLTGTSGGDVNGEFEIAVYLRDGTSQDEVSAIIDKSIAEFLADGVTSQWLANEQRRQRLDLRSSLEVTAEVGLIAGESAISTGNPMAFLRAHEMVQATNPREIQKVAEQWLSRNHYTSLVLPKGAQARPTGTAIVDRRTPPVIDVKLHAPQFPPMETAKLSNGIDVVMVPYRNDGIARVQLDFDFGLNSQKADETLIATLAFLQLDSGTKAYSKEELQREKDKLALDIQWSVMPYFSATSFEVLSEDLGASLDLTFDMLANPAYPAKELDRDLIWLKQALRDVQARPQQGLSWLLPRLAYGRGSKVDQFYTAEYLDGMTRDDVAAFHAREFRPERLAIYVAGDFDRPQLLKDLDEKFGRWSPPTASLVDDSPAPLVYKEGVIWLIDSPGAEQSHVMTLLPAPEFDLEKDPALQVMTHILGGGTSSRLGANLREDKGWTYGYSASIFRRPLGKQLLVTSGRIETAQTAPAIGEILSEMRTFVSQRPPTQDEMNDAVRARRGQLVDATVSRESIVASLARSKRFGAPPSWVTDDFNRYDKITLQEVRDVARETIATEKLGIIIIGDLDRIEKDIRALNFGETVVLDHVGNVIP